MNAVDITSVAAVIVTIVASLVIPAILRRRRSAEVAGATDVVSWKGITAVLQQERDSLREQLNAIETEYRARLHTMELEHAAQMEAAQARISQSQQRISQLESEVQELYARLGRQFPPPYPPTPPV